MKKIVYLALILCCNISFSNAQTDLKTVLKEIDKTDSIVWFGLDFSNAKFIGDFPERKKIIERELAGTFIPICTRNIFMKYYSIDVGDLKIWNEMDRDSYLNNIQEVINIFLTN